MNVNKCKITKLLHPSRLDEKEDRIDSVVFAHVSTLYACTFYAMSGNFVAS